MLNDFDFRSPRDQRVTEFGEHCFYLNGLVLHPAWRVAASYDVHDYSRGFIRIFSRWLRHLSRARRRKIVGIHGMDRRDLLSDIGFACSARLCHVASGDFDAHSSFSSPVGSTPAHCPLDDTNLALCLRHRCVCVLDALQMVSTAGVKQAILPASIQSTGGHCRLANSCAQATRTFLSCSEYSSSLSP